MNLSIKLNNEEYRKWIKTKKVNNPLNVTFTQKQRVNGQILDNISSEQNFKHFKNRLNKRVFGNGYRRFNKQLEMLVIREGTSQIRHHLHCVIEQPKRFGFNEFVSLIKTEWLNTKFGYNHIHIEKPTTQERVDGWLDYIMKDRTKIDLSTSIDFENSTILDH